MTGSNQPPAKSSFRVRDFRAARELSSYAIVAGVATLSIVAGIWGLLAASVGMFLFLIANLATRAEWRGRPLLTSLVGPSVFEEGLGVLPRDRLNLLLIMVANIVNAVVLIFIFGISLAWMVGVGMGIVISSAAGVLFISRHRAGRNE